jgi:hypothetical protein
LAKAGSTGAIDRRAAVPGQLLQVPAGVGDFSDTGPTRFEKLPKELLAVVIARNGATKRSSWFATARFAHLATTRKVTSSG